MEAIIIPLIILVGGVLLSGPVALIIAIIALNKAREVSRRVGGQAVPSHWPVKAPMPEMPKPVRPAPMMTSVPPMPVKPTADVSPIIPSVQAAEVFEQKQAAVDKQESRTFEQVIGTRWVLIAGIITVIVGIGFFLKYAYDNELIGPLGRVVIATVAGLVALAAGEITRKRQYGIVAKGVTAMGFAILYAAVFSAFRLYHLIDSTPTFVLAILITAAAMLYAVSLNEILIAVLSLIGGFLTPVLISTGENLPVPLFSYVLILGVGAMLCAWYRKWPAVNLIAFVGTVVLYTGWFEKFFRPQLREWAASGQAPEQMAIALGWLGVFFAVYLTLPLFYGLVNKSRAQRADVLLVLANAAITFYYLWTMLYGHYRVELAFCAVGLCVAHLVMLSVVIRRCAADIPLRLVLLVVGLFFLTIAIPLYLKLYAVAMAWAAEAVVLTFIGLRYRSYWTQICAGIAFVLSVGQLVDKLPMHSAAFFLVFNAACVAWLFVTLAAAVCHVLYRMHKKPLIFNCREIVSQVIYTVACFLLMLTLGMEWYWHCRYNLAGTIGQPVSEAYWVNGFMLLFAVLTVLLVLRPICPKGLLCKGAGLCVAFAGSVFTIVGLEEGYYDKFVLFANTNFGFALLFAASLFIAAWCLRRAAKQEPRSAVFAYVPAVAGIFVLWVLLSEEIYLYWYCQNRYSDGVANWRFLANMYMSVAWAIYGAVLMVVGFWRKIAWLRYISLGLFGVLLLKVFILDMSHVKSVYRIAAFLATGLTLVGVSYLYQFLVKQGFFDTLIEEKNKE